MTTAKVEPPKTSGVRIFHLVNSLEMGGSEHQMVEVASRQKKRGYQVSVGCLSLKGPLYEVLRACGISATEFNPRGALFRPAGIFQILRLARFLVKYPVDVVQTHDLYSTLLGVPAAWIARVPMILSCRRDLSQWWWYTSSRKKLLRHIQNRSTYVIANSQAVRDYLVEKEGFDSNLILIIRNGVDFERLSNVRANRQELFPHLGVETKLIAVVANMNVETKGHTDLIQAAIEVSGKFPHARFLLVGDGPERARLEQMVSQLGLSTTVLFLGRRNDVPNVLACCDLFVLPSWAEGLPNSVLEAMATGLPVVATSAGGTPEIIEDEVSGLLVPPKDAQALASAISRVLGSEGLALALRQSSRERARQFGFDRLLAELDSVYVSARAR